MKEFVKFGISVLLFVSMFLTYSCSSEENTPTSDAPVGTWECYKCVVKEKLCQDYPEMQVGNEWLSNEGGTVTFNEDHTGSWLLDGSTTTFKWRFNDDEQAIYATLKDKPEMNITTMYSGNEFCIPVNDMTCGGHVTAIYWRHYKRVGEAGNPEGGGGVTDAKTMLVGTWSGDIGFACDGGPQHRLTKGTITFRANNTGTQTEGSESFDFVYSVNQTTKRVSVTVFGEIVDYQYTQITNEQLTFVEQCAACNRNQTMTLQRVR